MSNQKLEKGRKTSEDLEDNLIPSKMLKNRIPQVRIGEYHDTALRD